MTHREFRCRRGWLTFFNVPYPPFWYSTYCILIFSIGGKTVSIQDILVFMTQVFCCHCQKSLPTNHHNCSRGFLRVYGHIMPFRWFWRFLTSSAAPSLCEINGVVFSPYPPDARCLWHWPVKSVKICKKNVSCWFVYKSS